MGITPLHFAHWFYLRDKDLCACVPAKCGGTSFYRAMFNLTAVSEHCRSAAVQVALHSGQGPYHAYEVHDLYPDKRKVMAIRDPVSRFASLWRDKYADLPPDDLLTRIRACPFGDPHWMPQYAHLVQGCEVIDYRQLPALLGYETHENATQPDETPMPVNEIRDLYAQDLALCG